MICNNSAYRRPTTHSTDFLLLAAQLLCLALLAPTLTRAAPLPGADGFTLVELSRDLANPVDFEIAPDGRIFILNRYGEVKVYLPNRGQTQVAIRFERNGTEQIYHESEAGLIGLALDPDFSTNQVLYLFYSPIDKSVNRVSSFRVVGNQIDWDSERMIIEVPTDRDGPAHAAGNLEFDRYGHLYIGTGDDAEHSDYAAIDENERNNSAEKSSSNTQDRRGKILRITPNPDGGYTIPAGNLFPDGTEGDPTIYVMGARNPYKFSIDPVTNWLFWGDVGPDANSPQGVCQGPATTLTTEGQDEINLTRQAGNYGWPYFIGNNHAYDIRGRCNDPAAPSNDSRWNTGATQLPPAQPSWFTIFHASYMAGPVYRVDASVTDTSKLPAQFDQHLFYWDFNQSLAFYAGFDASGNLIRNERLAENSVNFGTIKGLIDMEIGPDGHLFLLEYGTGCCDMETGNGKLYRLDYTGEAAVTQNLARNRPVTVSSVETGTDAAAAEDLTGANAVDGDPKTRWSSAFSEPQWLVVDLGKAAEFRNIVIQWDYSYASAYRIEISDDAQYWTEIYAQPAGTGGTENITLDAPVKSRYVRVYATARGVEAGTELYSVSIHELEILGNVQSAPIANTAFKQDQFQGSGTCGLCHNGLRDSAGNALSIVNAWSPSSMANATRDPYWQAKVAAELKRNPLLADEINDQCTRCHAPMANYPLRQTNAPLQIFNGGILDNTHPYFDAAMDGVSCTVCHQLEDTGQLGSLETSSGNFSIARFSTPNDPERPAYGQYADPEVTTMKLGSNFTPTFGPHLERAEICASCHDLLTPKTDATNGQPVTSQLADGFPEQMIFSEWKHSDFRDGGAQAQTCQGCHMPKVNEPVQIASNPPDSKKRPGFAKHHMTGANTNILAILRDNRRVLGVLANGFDDEIARTQSLLRSAAQIDIESAVIANGVLTAQVKLTNLTGHKLPSGYPSRRAFIHFSVTDAQGQTLFESGKPTPEGRIEGNTEDVDATTYEPHYAAITSADQVQIYESIMADAKGRVTHTLMRGDHYLKDNRLPPKGFDKSQVPEHIAVMGNAASDADFNLGQDMITYQLPVETADLIITARLLYQPLAYGHLQDLFNDNDLDVVDRFQTMFEASSNKIEEIAVASRTLSASASGGGSGGGGVSTLWCLVLLGLSGQRAALRRKS